MYVRARPKRAGKCDDARPTAANHSQEWTNRFSASMEKTQRISTNQTKSSDFCVNEEK